jgi:Na+-driven multidrug efflux pump
MFVTMLVLSGGTYLARRQVVTIFTDDESVIDMTAAVVPAVAGSLIGRGGRGEGERVGGGRGRGEGRGN